MDEAETDVPRRRPRHLLDQPKHALILQGPMGPFFREFGAELRTAGVEVTHVAFNAADALFLLGSGTEVVFDRGDSAGWETRLRALVGARGIDICFLFGDQRPLHRVAVAVLESMGVSVWVFEEGYLRPDFITLEPHGVNGNSRLPRDTEVYRQAARPAPPPPPRPVGATFARHALFATVYAIVLTFTGFWLTPRYRHHRPLNAFAEAFAWLRSGARKLRFARREAPLMERFAGELAKRFFLVPLQVHNDAQFEHADFHSPMDFLEHVVASFAAHGRPDDLLLVKHHPMDRGYREYGEDVTALARAHGLGERLVYVHDLHLPTLLKCARGVVTMNSTTGLQALHHGCPTKVLGRSIYDLPGLASQQSLAEFFAAPEGPDPELYVGFERYLRRRIQPNGSFVRKLPGVGGCGVRWPRAGLEDL